MLPEHIRNKVNYIAGNIFDHSMEDADIIYTSNICFKEETNSKIAEKFVKEAKPGTIIFSSRQLIDPKIEQLGQRIVEMTWSKQSPIFMAKKL